jgi:hypothetical protein
VRTDRRTDKTKLIGVFENFANAPKSEKWYTEADKTNDGKYNIMKEVKRKQ